MAHSRHFSDSLLVIDNPLLLGATIRERTAQRDLSRPVRQASAVWLADFVRYFNRIAEQFPALFDQRWGVPMPSLPLEGVVTTPIGSGGHALVWRTATGSIGGPIMWANHRTLERIIDRISAQAPLPVWLIPVWMLEKYHPLEAAYNWVLRTLHDRLLLVNWLWQPRNTPTTDEEPHPAVAILLESFAYYKAFVDTLPKLVRDKLPFYAQSGFDLVADIHEHSDPDRARIVYAFMPRPGSQVTFHQHVLDETDQHNVTTLLIEGSDGTWSANIDGGQHSVLSLHSAMLYHVLGERATHQAQSWLRSDLKKHLPGFPPGVW